MKKNQGECYLLQERLNHKVFDNKLKFYQNLKENKCNLKQQSV